MPDFEVPLEKAIAIRKCVAEQGGILMPPEMPAALYSTHRTIQIIHGEPLVVDFSGYENTDGDNATIMEVITSKELAKQEWFREIISPKLPNLASLVQNLN